MRYYELVQLADPCQNICVYDASKDKFHFGLAKSLSDCNVVDSNARVISLRVGNQHLSDEYGRVINKTVPVMQVEVDSI